MKRRVSNLFWVAVILVVWIIAYCGSHWICGGAAQAAPRSAVVAHAAQTEFPDIGLCLPGRCYEVHDGDTVYVEFTFRAHVRLLDCWAPELDAPGGIESRDALKAYAEGKDVRMWVPAGMLMQSIRADHRDVGDLTSMGRILGRVQIVGAQEDLSAHQVRSGMAATLKGRPLGQ